MKANELRIGNYHHLIEEGVDPLDTHEVCDGYSLYLIDKNSNAEPIKLTEEWLLKFGFEKMEDFSNGIDNITYLWTKERTSFFIEPDFSFNTEYLEIKIRSVHELQNLYYALNGEDLTLNNNNNNGNKILHS